MTETIRKTYYSVAETAVFLRAALKQTFPGVTFSVKSKSYSGGASITVKWTDGPIASDVEKVCGLYEGASFDGMVDLKSYHDTLVMTEDGPRSVHYGADYIFENRSCSSDLLSRVYLFTCRKYGITPRVDAIRDTSWGAELTNEASNDQVGSGPWSRHWEMGETVRRELSKATITNGALIVRKS